MVKKLLEIHVNLISQNQNSAIIFISRQTFSMKQIQRKKLNQIVEDCAIPGGALPFFIRYCIILSIC